MSYRFGKGSMISINCPDDRCNLTVGQVKTREESSGYEGYRLVNGYWIYEEWASELKIVEELCHITTCKYYNTSMDLNCEADEDTCERCNCGEEFELEMLCPTCKCEMKEYVNRYRCRNLDCRLTIDKYFKIEGSN